MYRQNFLRVRSSIWNTSKMCKRVFKHFFSFFGKISNFTCVLTLIMFNQQRENRKYTIQLHNRPTKEGVVSYLWLHLGHQNGTACYFLRKKMFLPIFNCCELCRIKSSVRRTGDDGWRLLGHFLWPIKAMLTNGCRPLPLSSAAFIFQWSYHHLLFPSSRTPLFVDEHDIIGFTRPEWTCKIDVKEWI